MIILAVDFGLKRIGLAYGQSDINLPTALPTILASGALKKDANAIAAIAQKVEAELIVIGDPQFLNPGDHGKMQKACRALASILMEAGLNTKLENEAFTSLEAEAWLKEAGQSGSQVSAKKDGVAACLIFSRYVEKLSS